MSLNGRQVGIGTADHSPGCTWPSGHQHTSHAVQLEVGSFGTYANASTAPS